MKESRRVAFGDSPPADRVPGAEDGGAVQASGHDVAQHNDYDPPTDTPTDTASLASTSRTHMARMDAAMGTASGNFKIRPLLLTFEDPEVERQYVGFVTTRGSFVAGKLYAFIAAGVVFTLFWPYVSWAPERRDVTDLWAIIWWASVLIGFVVCGTMFVGALVPWREVLFFTVVATHWPAFAAGTLVAKDDGMYTYAYTTICFIYCCFTAQPRFVALSCLLTATPVATFFVSTYTKKGYWDKHSHLEMLFWIAPLFPLLMLRTFERRSREAFAEAAVGEAHMAALAERAAVTRKIVAHFFPRTAALRLLRSEGKDASAEYVGAGLVVTDVVGFTAWASTTSSDIVVARVAKMFVAIEHLGRRFGAEKVSTVGDAYVGAILPAGRGSRGLLSPTGASSRTQSAAQLSPHQPDTEMQCLNAVVKHEQHDDAVSRRAHSALRFATAVTRNRDVMPVRVGVHVGDVLGGFIGSHPPKFDLFGDAVREAQRLEATGTQMMLHASRAVLRAADALGFARGAEEPTEHSVLLKAWSANREPRREPHAADCAVQDFEASVGRTSAHSPVTVAPADGDAVFSTMADEAPAAPEAVSTEEQAKRELDDEAAAAAAEEDEVERQALLLCAYLQAMGEQQRSRADGALRARERADAAAKRHGRAGDSPQPQQSVLRSLLPQSATACASNRADERRLLSGTCDTDDEYDDEEMESGLGTARSVSLSFRGSPPGSARVPADEDSSDVADIANEGDELSMYTFSIFTLTFDDPEVEERHKRRYIQSGFATQTYAALCVFAIYAVTMQAAVGCVHTTRNRLSLAAQLSLFTAYLASLHEHGTAHGFTPLLIVLVTVANGALAALAYESGCEGAESRRNAERSAIAMHLMLPAVFWAFNLEVRLPLRVAVHTLLSGFVALAILLRRVTVQDELLGWDLFTFTVFAALAFPSYFSDFMLRSGYQATMRRRALQSNRSRHAEQAAAALELMLPTFVADRLVQAARRAAVTPGDGAGGRYADVASFTGSAASLGSQKSTASAVSASALSTAAGRTDAAQAMLLRRLETVWPYSRAAVVFIAFAPPRLTFSVISDTITRIETVARGRSLQKVKTIGTTMLLVTGIDRAVAFEDALANAVEACLEVQRNVFPAHLTQAGWWSRAGVHCGPMFGAVIGSEGLAFDVYGDTVNTASRMQTTAAPNTVRCSAAVRAALPAADELDFALVSLGDPVKVKGKGDMAVFEAIDRRRTFDGSVSMEMLPTENPGPSRP